MVYRTKIINSFSEKTNSKERSLTICVSYRHFAIRLFVTFRSSNRMYRIYLKFRMHTVGFINLENTVTLQHERKPTCVLYFESIYKLSIVFLSSLFLYLSIFYYWMHVYALLLSYEKTFRKLMCFSVCKRMTSIITSFQPKRTK